MLLIWKPCFFNITFGYLILTHQRQETDSLLYDFFNLQLFCLGFFFRNLIKFVADMWYWLYLELGLGMILLINGSINSLLLHIDMYNNDLCPNKSNWVHIRIETGNKKCHVRVLLCLQQHFCELINNELKLKLFFSGYCGCSSERCFWN